MFKDMEKWVEIRRRVLTGEISKRGACQEYELQWRTLRCERLFGPLFTLTPTRLSRPLSLVRMDQESGSLSRLTALQNMLSRTAREEAAGGTLS